ncbi:MAG: helix-turn-helix domain-containing protein [Tannerellaceae bacterium]|jgi:AraC-like DNA-binding protein|nr:helix-turn-helix domain-containing protein [Tannerellaceae bacterium]
MDKNIIPFDWKELIDNAGELDRLGDDFILLDKPIITSVFKHPFRIDVVAAIICIEGRMDGFMSLTEQHVTAPGFYVVMPGNILEYKGISDDFKGLFIVMSKRFTESLDIGDSFPFFLSVSNNPYIALDAEGVEAFIQYFSMMQRMIRQKDNPNRIEIARHLTKAFFYGAGYYLHNIADNSEATKQEILVRKFLNLVEANCKRERNMSFYEDKICLTAKHISTVIKEVTGKTASDWIEGHVVLEAKALLKSSTLTIQQISDELNFPSQSFFGKYFKRITGLSPKEYRNTK